MTMFRPVKQRSLKQRKLAQHCSPAVDPTETEYKIALENNRIPFTLRAQIINSFEYGKPKHKEVEGPEVLENR